jgi:hypothetical protein
VSSEGVSSLSINYAKYSLRNKVELGALFSSSNNWIDLPVRHDQRGTLNCKTSSPQLAETRSRRKIFPAALKAVGSR